MVETIKWLIKQLSISPAIKKEILAPEPKRDLKSIFHLPNIAPGISFLAKTIYLIFLKNNNTPTDVNIMANFPVRKIPYPVEIRPLNKIFHKRGFKNSFSKTFFPTNF